MSGRRRFLIEVALSALAAAGSVCVATPTAFADDGSSMPCRNQTTGCSMDIAQLRVIPADHKIDWGASDYDSEQDIDAPANGHTDPNTKGYPLGTVPAPIDGGPCGTDDDYPPATPPTLPLPPQCTGSTGTLAQDVTGAGDHPYLNIFLRYCEPQTRPHDGQFKCDNPTKQGFARLRGLTLKLPAWHDRQPAGGTYLSMGDSRARRRRKPSAPTRSSGLCAVGS